MVQNVLKHSTRAHIWKSISWIVAAILYDFVDVVVRTRPQEIPVAIFFFFHEKNDSMGFVTSKNYASLQN